MKDVLAYLITEFQFTPKSTLASIVSCVILNGVIRFGAVYLAVRVFLTAVNHGSF